MMVLGGTGNNDLPFVTTYGWFSFMLVSHRYKFIYTKTRKTAGSSVESYFEPFCMGEGEWTERHFREEYVSAAGIIGFRGKPANMGAARWWNHMPARLIRERLGEDTWRSYFKFCVIRNPFEKAISAFYHDKRNDRSGRPRQTGTGRPRHQASP